MNDQIVQKELESWLYEKMLTVRRAIHRYPELSEQEFQTQSLLRRELDLVGIQNLPCANTGVIAIVKGTMPGRTVAIRADIDALPIEEKSDDSCRSERLGIMHACGHDAHTAIALGTALFFQKHREKLAGNIKIFFQPAEETVGGAARMVEEGCLHNPDVDACIGLHVMPSLPHNTIESKHDTLNASADSFTIVINGKEAHGARPEEGIDALLIGAHVVTALQHVVSRKISALEPAVLTIGSFHAGKASNVLAGEARLTGTFRASSPAVRKKGRLEIENVCRNIATGMGTTAEIYWDDNAYPPLVNNNAVVDRILAVGKELLGNNHVIIRPQMSMGAEDFSFFNQNIPGAFYHLGCQKKGSELYGLHSSGFAIDERCLATGCRMHIAVCLDLLQGDLLGTSI